MGPSVAFQAPQTVSEMKVELCCASARKAMFVGTEGIFASSPTVGESSKHLNLGNLFQGRTNEDRKEDKKGLLITII